MGEVSLSGSCLSSLLFKLKNASGDTEGFLLGKVCSHKVDTITDSQSSGQKEEKKICLHSSICFDKKHSFYDYSCKLDFEKIESVLGARSTDLIGWFSYRRCSSHRLSLKEKAVHRKLVETAKHLQSKGEEGCGIEASDGDTRCLIQDFLLLLITDETVEMSGVCSTDYSFHSWDGSRFRSLSSKMLTLPSSVSYQLLPTRLLPQHLVHYNQVLAEQRLHFGSSGQMEQSRAMEQLCAALLHKLEPLKEELISTSEQVRAADKEVSKLRLQLALAEEEEEEEALHTSTSNSNMPVEDMEPAMDGGTVSTGVLIDLNGEEDITDQLLEDMEPGRADTVSTGVLVDLNEKEEASPTRHNTSLPPPLPSVDSDAVLVPEKLTSSTELPDSTTNSTTNSTTSTHTQDQPHQYLSQELF